MTDRLYLCEIAIKGVRDSTSTRLWKWVLETAASSVPFEFQGSLAVFDRSPGSDVLDSIERLSSVGNANSRADLLAELGKVGIYVVSIELLSDGEPLCSIADGESVSGYFDTEDECQRMRDFALSIGIGEPLIECLNLTE